MNTLRRTRLWLAGLFLLAPFAGAQEDLAGMVGKAKSATAYIVVKQSGGGEEMKGSGSGFFIDQNTVITNWHVVRPESRLALDSQGLHIEEMKVDDIKVVIHSGTEKTQQLACTVAMHSEEDDLAVLKVQGGTAPAVLALGDSEKLVETQGLWVFGFPFGEMLAIGKRGPAISVNKANVTSLRRDDDSILQIVQFDGAANPGNSGGPIVDAAGNVVAILFAGVRDSNNVNLGIPVNVLKSLLNGRITEIDVDPPQVPKEGGTVKVTCKVSTPKGLPQSIRGALESDEWESIPFAMQAGTAKGTYSGQVKVPAYPDMTTPLVFTAKVTGKDPAGKPLNIARAEIHQLPASRRPTIAGRPVPGTPGGGEVASAGGVALQVSNSNAKIVPIEEGIAAYNDSKETISGVPEWMTSTGCQLVRSNKLGADFEVNVGDPVKFYLLKRPGLALPFMDGNPDWKKNPSVKIKVGGANWDCFVRYFPPGTWINRQRSLPPGAPSYLLIASRQGAGKHSVAGGDKPPTGPKPTTGSKPPAGSKPPTGSKAGKGKTKKGKKPPSGEPIIILVPIGP